MDRRNRRCEAIRATLAGPARGEAEPAGQALELWGRLLEQLTPVLGTLGVEALVIRSLQVAGRGPLRSEPRLPPLATLGACLEPGLESNVALLMVFTDLLVTLIGASLTDRMLAPIWAAPATPQETRP